MDLSCESFDPQDDITVSANFMKDYIALVTVELHKFARQIAEGVPAGGARFVEWRPDAQLAPVAAICRR